MSRSHLWKLLKFRKKTSSKLALDEAQESNRRSYGLVVTEITARLEDHIVLESVSLCVGPGEVAVIIGPNGAGKTTLLRAMLGLVPLESGQVTAASDGKAANASLAAYVPQRHEFDWEFPVSVNGAVMSGRTRMIGWFKRASDHDREAVEEAMRTTGLIELRDRPIRELSGGQRQRVLVARALATQPQSLLMDEPFNGVDAPTQRVMIDLVKTMQAEGKAILVTTHDLSVVEEIASKVLLLNKRVIAEGCLKELMRPGIWDQAYGFVAPSMPVSPSSGDI